MIIWTRQGYLGFLLMMGAFFGVQGIVDRYLGPGAFAAALWPKLAVLALSVTSCWLVGRWLNRGLPRRVFELPRTITDPITGQATRQGIQGHTLAWIRLEHAGWVMALVLALVVLKERGLLD